MRVLHKQKLCLELVAELVAKNILGRNKKVCVLYLRFFFVVFCLILGESISLHPHVRHHLIHYDTHSVLRARVQQSLFWRQVAIT